MKKTLDQIAAAHPELRSQLLQAARNYVPQSFDGTGEPLYFEEGLLIAARTQGGDDAFSRNVKGAANGICYR